MRKNLVLTGMMGVGKSTIGKKLAYHLDHVFIDIDYLIEKKEGCSIAVIFKNKGESYFRTLEKKITLRELKKNNAVISLGGGAFLEKTIRRAVKDTSVSFWLDVSTNILVKRLQKTDKRPLLLKKNLNETVKKIYLDRKKSYSEADFRVKCDSSKTDIIVNKILKIYENSSN